MMMFVQMMMLMFMMIVSTIDYLSVRVIVGMIM